MSSFWLLLQFLIVRVCIWKRGKYVVNCIASIVTNFLHTQYMHPNNIIVMLYTWLSTFQWDRLIRMLFWTWNKNCSNTSINGTANSQSPSVYSSWCSPSQCLISVSYTLYTYTFIFGLHIIILLSYQEVGCPLPVSMLAHLHTEHCLSLSPCHCPLSRPHLNQQCLRQLAWGSQLENSLLVFQNLEDSFLVVILLCGYNV